MNDVLRGPKPLGSILRQAHPELLVSKYKLRQAEGIHLVRQRREDGNQVLGFNSRPFVLCGLPLRRPPKDQLLYERRNGNFVLQVTGHPEFGLPFGQDRLVPIFLATMAVRQQSKTIRFKSASVMLETFGMSKGGKEYRRLVSAFERIFGATMFFGTESTSAGARVVHRARFNFLREATIWYQRDGVGGENVVTLSEEFFSEVMAHPIPTDLEAVKVLVAASGVLDLFVWLSYRCFTAKGQESIPLFEACRTDAPNRLRRLHATTPFPRDARPMANHYPSRLARVPGPHQPRWLEPRTQPQACDSYTSDGRYMKQDLWA